MFEGIFFQFPKLGFLLFFFLACEALCPLRSAPIYFSKPRFFDEAEVRSPLWLWISKWAMITSLIIALMSPVREIERTSDAGYDILLVLDPASALPETLTEAAAFLDRREGERIALWVPGQEEKIVPLTRDHEALKSILSRTDVEPATAQVSTSLSRFFATSSQGSGWAIILSNDPERFVHALPVGIETSVIVPRDDPHWGERVERSFPPTVVLPERRFFEYYYVYPLFAGFIAMLVYLYGRNQKGLK